MKRIFFICTFLCAFFAAQAQWSFGVKAGLNSAKINYPGTIENPSNLTGINLGGVATYQLNKWFDLQAELTYNQLGYLEKDIVLSDAGEPIEDGDMKCRHHYISLPVLVKFFPIKGFNIQFGPQFGYMAGSQTKVNGYDEPINPDYNKSDFSLAFGVGYEFDFGLFIDTRYMLGLTPTIHNMESWENRAYSLSVGYRFYM